MTLGRASCVMVQKCRSLHWFADPAFWCNHFPTRVTGSHEPACMRLVSGTNLQTFHDLWPITERHGRCSRPQSNNTWTELSDTVGRKQRCTGLNSRFLCKRTQVRIPTETHCPVWLFFCILFRSSSKCLNMGINSCPFIISGHPNFLDCIMCSS
jgi:hypothetical protein